MIRKLIVGFAVILLLTASALAFPAGWWLFNNVPGFFDEKPSIARADIKWLENVVVENCKKRGYYPETLLELTMRSGDSPPVMIKDASKLIDPWGQPYQYEPQKLHPKTELPLIWSAGSPRKKTPARITNWD